MNIVGITGRVYTPEGLYAGIAGAGKDSVAQRLNVKHSFVVYSLAAPLKRMLACLPHMEEYMWDDRKWKEAVHPIFGCTRRHMAQTLGTEWRNMNDQHMWLRLADRRIELAERAYSKGIAIPDIRFEHEARWLRDRGGMLLVVVRRNGDVDPQRAAHVSEHPLAALGDDYILDNDGTLRDLGEKVDAFVSGLS